MSDPVLTHARAKLEREVTDIEKRTDLTHTKSDGPYLFTAHAIDRLAQRTRLTEEQVIHLLNNKAFKRIHVKLAPNLSKAEIDQRARILGVDFLGMKDLGLVKIRKSIEHLLIWSIPDERPITLIIGITEFGAKKIITVLFSDDDSRHEWSDKVTEQAILIAKSRAEQLIAPPDLQLASSDHSAQSHELFVTWIRNDGALKRKIFKNFGILSISPMAPTIAEIEAFVRTQCVESYDIRIYIRNKKNPADIAYERRID